MKEFTNANPLIRWSCYPVTDKFQPRTYLVLYLINFTLIILTGYFHPCYKNNCKVFRLLRINYVSCNKETMQNFNLSLYLLVDFLKYGNNYRTTNFRLRNLGLCMKP